MNVFRQAGMYVLAGALALAGCSGAKGPAGAPGTNGTNCSVANNTDGSATITCTDGTSATVAKGTNGTDGTSCGVADNGNGTATITCPGGTTATVRNGTDGAGCVVVNNNNGTRTITCGNNTGVTVSDAVVDYALLSDPEKADANPTLVVTDVSVPADGKPVVTLKVSDRKGNGIKNLSTLAPASVSWRFGLLTLKAGVNGSANDTWVNYNGTSATSTASAETAVTGTTLTDNADGTYSFKFSKSITGGVVTAYDPAAPHRVVVILSKSVSGANLFAPMNFVRDFAPATGFATDLTGQNDKVDGAACLECHTAFRAKAGGTGKFHGGARYDVRSCVACHNDQQRFSTLSASNIDGDATDTTVAWTGSVVRINGEAIINLPVFIHKIHMGEELTQTGAGAGKYSAIPQPYEIHYPQDVRNCAKCHRAPAAKADNWKAAPSRRACGACHDGVSFAATVPAGRVQHSGGAYADDSACAGCHSLTSGLGVAAKHVPVAPPDPNSTYAGGTNANTNAAYLAAANAVPAGASKITYVVSSVGKDGSNHPQIVFKLQKDGADVVFNTPGAGVTELITNFVGSPSVYFVYALPQDGIQTPADFNASASGYLRSIWNGTATGSGAGTLTGPDSTGLYTVTLTGVTVPATATMLTGGVGYTYSLTSTQPLTQTNVPGYAYNTTTKIGGLIVAAPNVTKVATGYTARRAIVSTAKCNGCHEQLGANPTFHAGNRNDAPTCSFCHNPGRTSSGWSANAKEFIHAIHAADKRAVPFNWHATSATEGFYQVTYPAILNNCEQCHLSGTYDFSATASAAAVPNLLASTVGQGRYNGSPTTNPTGYYSLSPYVDPSNQTDYGYGFATSNVSATLPDGISGTQGGNACTPAAPCVCTTANPCSVDVSAPYTVNNVAVSFSQKIGTVTTACTAGTPCTCTTAQPCTGVVATCSVTAPCNAQGTTLVKTPITAACSACHDAPLAIDHMESNGGAFYKPRAATLPSAEQCLICHGPGKIAAIADVHK